MIQASLLLVDQSHNNAPENDGIVIGIGISDFLSIRSPSFRY